MSENTNGRALYFSGDETRDSFFVKDVKHKSESGKEVEKNGNVYTILMLGWFTTRDYALEAMKLRPAVQSDYREGLYGALGVMSFEQVKQRWEFVKSEMRDGYQIIGGGGTSDVSYMVDTIEIKPEIIPVVAGFRRLPKREPGWVFLPEILRDLRATRVAVGENTLPQAVEIVQPVEMHPIPQIAPVQ